MVAFCTGQTKNTVRKLCSLIADRGMVFDAVYRLKRMVKDRTNITHALLDFWDEDQDLGKQAERSVILLSPDKVNPLFSAI